MIDIKDELKKLPPPDPEAHDRIWSRYRDSRRGSPWARRWLPLAGLVAIGAAAAVAVVVRTADAPRHVAYEHTGAVESTQWSSVVALDVHGRGEVSGTDRDVEIAWEAGTVTAHVAPDTGTRLVVVTDEARVEVVGTVFSVTRDALGVHTSVDRGKVRVTCDDGWGGMVTPETGGHTCLPTRAALLLGRADALADANASLDTRMATIERGVSRAEPGSVVHAELLFRRMHVFGDRGEPERALADARTYLASGVDTRTVEVQRYAGYLALGSRGCDSALAFLAPLESAGTASDRVLLAECLGDDPGRARALLNGALAEGLDDTWAERARADLTALEGR